MKKYLFLISLFALLFSAGCTPPQNDAPKSQFRLAAEKRLAQAGENRAELEKALAQVPDSQREALHFLIAYMPQHDLESLKASFLLENVEYAYKARQKMPYAQIPDSIFYNYVLPYANMNERRDNWRKDFFLRFAPLAQNCRTAKQAIDTINHNIAKLLQVEYNTERKKPDQSPYESISQGRATCSGLSVLLADAFRAVAIPARIAGVPNWHNNRGNHSWVEVWIDGQWYFTEYYPDELNKSWFLGDAGKATPGSPEFGIFAVSFKKTPTPFRLVWDTTITYVSAVEVTPRYIDLYKKNKQQKKLSKSGIPLKIRAYNQKKPNYKSHDRISLEIAVFNKNKKIFSGFTAGKTDDLNNVLTAYLKPGKKYTLQYKNYKNELVEKNIAPKDSSEILIFFQSEP